MAVSIPLTGDRIPDGWPSVLKVVKVTAGCATAVVDVGSSSMATYSLATLPMGAYVYDVGWQVEEVYGSNCTITIGDSDTAAGWAAASDVVATVANDAIVTARQMWFTNLANALVSSNSDTTGTALTAPAYFLTGMQCSSADSRDLEITVAGEDTLTGKIAVYIYYHMAYWQKRIASE